MTLPEAQNIAQQYVSGMGEILPGFIFGIGQASDFSTQYYFDLIFLTTEGVQPDQPPVAGGACGVKVDKKSREVKLVTHAEYSSLIRQQEELNKTYELINEFKHNGKNLTIIKDKYQLDSKQLLQLSKALGDKEVTKERTLEILDALIAEVKNYR